MPILASSEDSITSNTSSLYSINSEVTEDENRVVLLGVRSGSIHTNFNHYNDAEARLYICLVVLYSGVQMQATGFILALIT